MSRKDFFAALKTHAASHPGMLGVVGRIFCYTIGVAVSMFVSDMVFNDGYTMTLSIFILFAVMFELLWNTPATVQYEKSIKQHCLSCTHCAGSPQRILECQRVECPFHSHRPFQFMPAVRWRLLCYILCVVGISVVGFFLARESNAVRNDQQQQRPAAIERQK